MAAREEEEFIMVRNKRGKANIWRHFCFKKRKTDNTIVENIAVLPPSPSPPLPPPPLTRTHMHACAHTRTHTHYAHISPLPPPSHSSEVSFSLLLPTRHVFLPALSLCLLLLPICPWQRNKEPSKPGAEVKLLTVAIDIRREREQITASLCTPVYRCKIPVLGWNTVKNTSTVIRTGTQPY